MKPQPIVTTREEAWKIENKYEDQPHGWVQWKGTNICMDVHCQCGELSHVDADFCYHIKCGYCGTVYYCNGHIQLIQLSKEPDHVIVTKTGMDDL